MSLGWTFISQSGGSLCHLQGRLLILQHSPDTLSSRCAVAQEPALLPKGGQRDQEADTPHGPYSRWTKIQLKKYFIKLLLFLISSGEYWLVWLQGCSEVKMERSKAGTLVCSAWVFGMLPGTGQALGKAPVGEQGCACLPPLLLDAIPSGLSLSTTWLQWEGRRERDVTREFHVFPVVGN